MSPQPLIAPPPCARTVRGRLLLGALGLAVASGAAGCGGDDAGPPALKPETAVTTGEARLTATGPVNGRVIPPPTTTTSADGATETTVVESPTIASGVDERRGVRLAVETVRDGLNGGKARVTFTVTPTAPAAVRRRLARTAGYILNCDLGGRGDQGAELRPTGSRTALAPGTTRRTGGFLVPPKGRTVREALRACSLFLARERRGSTSRSYESGSPQRAYATVRFR